MERGADNDILADFLTEAGELVDALGHQLVALESRPQDTDLLNAIFRAFHTIKGGAGFLDLQPLVAICHATEDVFNALRAGRRAVDAELMDAVLLALDQVQAMMSALAAGAPLADAPAPLLQRLRRLVPAASDVAASPAAPVSTAHAAVSPVTAEAKADQAPCAAASATITDDEFEALLDQLHGKNGAPGAGVVSTEAGKAAAPAPPVAPAPGAHPREVGRPAPAETTVRVDTARLDRMMNLVGELVLVRNRLKDLRMRNADPQALARAVGELDFITRGLQNAVMQIRMQPIGKVFARFPKIARDLARTLGKQVEVELVGEDTDLDKNLVEMLVDPLVHMVRNSVDHGIEPPEERVRCGKSPAGHLQLAARQQGDNILISVRDDGAGMDPERIRAKAVEKGLLGADEAAQLSPEACLQLVFLPGFSTKEQVSDLSGRGVGMDVVMSRIKELGGAVHIDSRVGQGTTIHIRLPLTLAILSALMVSANGRRYALPLAPVLDIFELDCARIEKLDRWDVVLTRRDTLRLVHLDPWLRAGGGDTRRHVVVAQIGDERFGFVVREVHGREEIVIKPLGSSLRGLPGISGATVLPDGHIALILDFAGLVEAYRCRLPRPRTDAGMEAAHG